MTAVSIEWKSLPASDLGVNKGLRADWNRLNAARSDLPFLGAEAIATAVAVFGQGGERLLIGRQADQVVAMLVASKAGRFRWQTFQPAQIPLGAWVAAPGPTLEALSNSLNRAGFGFCVTFSVTQIDPMFAPRMPDAANTRTADYIETGWVDIAGSFDDFWSARGKNLRQNMRKQRNKLETEGISGRMRKFTSPEDMAPAIARYGVLESAGWKAASGTAIHPDNDQGRFYTRLMQDAASRGEAFVYEYLFDDRVVAVNLCLGRGQTITILKTTYDESTHPFSPAFLLLQDVLEEIYGEGRWKRVEFYGRMMEWHTRWTDQKRSLYHLTCYRWPFLKQLAARKRKEDHGDSEPA